MKARKPIRRKTYLKASRRPIAPRRADPQCAICGDKVVGRPPAELARYRNFTCLKPECVSELRSRNAFAQDHPKGRIKKRTPSENLFWAKVSKDPDGCWRWTGRRHPIGGYPQLDVPRHGLTEASRGWVTVRAHRYSYELNVGPIPPGLHLDHLCRNTGCVNPEHLEPVTSGENNRRANLATGRYGPTKTRCINGHPWIPENIRVQRSGKRTCRVCYRDGAKMLKRRIRARKADPSRRAWAKHRCSPFIEWLKQQPCVITGCSTGDWGKHSTLHYAFRIIVDPAHLIPRGRGAPDLYNCVSLARHLHECQEKRTDQFNAEHGVNLWELAKQQTEEWLRTADGLAWRDAHLTNEESQSNG